MSKHPGGRPTKYNDEALATAIEYVEEHKTKYDDEIPSVAGLSCVLGVARDTIYQWGRDDNNKEFSDTLKELQSKQETVLWNKGLNGKFNPTIAKLALSNHGYHDKVDTNQHNTGQVDLKWTVEFRNPSEKKD